MQLKDILQNIPALALQGSTDVAITAVVQDSRKVGVGSLFVAVKGTQTDGHQFLAQVLEKQVSAVIYDADIDISAFANSAVTWIKVRNSAEALALAACNFYGNPSKKLKLVGITGTNGKTTTVTMLYRLFRALGYNVGLLSTVENRINDEVIPATHTTPDAVTLNELLAKMVAKNCQFAFMEVSSHALVQQRVAGIQFAGAIFSNITHDHLDYHHTFDEYIKAKKLLFDGLPKTAFALVNKDDKRAAVMLQNTAAKTYSFALKTGADFKARILDNSLKGLHLDVNGQEVHCKLIGEFNAYNLMGIYGAAVLLGEDAQEALQVLSGLSAAAGRFEQVVSAEGVCAIVDYAHTPDALQNVLETISQLRTGNEQVITVVGCGGNRDATKRPIMANLACKYSNKVILTSDNPRFEAPEAILADMEAGVAITDKTKVTVIVDRKEALRLACSWAKGQDIILIAGKGHETYQEIKGVKYDFDDKKIVEEIFGLN